MQAILDLARRLTLAPSRANEELSAFVEAHEFPLVEDGTATFFFWAPQSFDEVNLVHWVFGLESRQSFQRLGDTGAYYLPLDLPRAARVEYKLELISGGRRTWIRDPLNPLRAFDPFGSNSVCQMPGYEAPIWTEPEDGVRPGRVELIPVKSGAWGAMREARVYTPNEYKPHKRYPLLICHDGSDYLRFAKIQTVLDNLIHRKEVAPLVVCFTDGVNRNPEYGANPLQARFLVEDLLPAVARRFGISPDPDDRGLMGASFGAVSSLYTAWHHPGHFGRLMLQSGSFVFTDVGTHDRGPLFDPVVEFLNAFRGDPGRSAARIFMSCGTFESLIYYNRSLIPLLRRAGLTVRFRESHDGHNWIAWRDHLRNGLTWLFPGRLWMYYE